MKLTMMMFRDKGNPDLVDTDGFMGGTVIDEEGNPVDGLIGLGKDEFDDWVEDHPDAEIQIEDMDD